MGEKMAIKKAVVIAAIGCIAALGLFIIMELSGITYRVTGLDLSQRDMTIVAKWDAMDSKEYVVSLFDGDNVISEDTVDQPKHVIGGIDPRKEYRVEVTAKDKEGNESFKDSAEITTKQAQRIILDSDKSDIFTAKTMTLKARATGPVKFKSDDESVATVNAKGKVKIKGNGVATITVSAAETSTRAASSRSVTLHAGETYQEELPELPNAIASEAVKLAWPLGTSRSKYRYGGGGAPTGLFKETIARVYPNHMHWKIKQTRWGASCDVFVGTVVRGCGYDMNFPKGLRHDYSYLPRSSKFKKVSLSDLQPGDILLYAFKGGGGHICIYVENDNGTGYITNAHYHGKTYGMSERTNPHWNPRKYKSFGVYRATGDCTAPLSEGETGEDVEQLQQFLKWSGFFKGEVDGDFGEGTIKAVESFQKATGLEVDGKFGQEAIDKAKKYKVNYIQMNDINETGAEM